MSKKIQSSRGKEFLYTVRQLKERLNGVPDDTPILYQRIEDVYFKKHGWKTIELPWDQITSEYIEAFQSYYRPKQKVFVIDAHF